MRFIFSRALPGLLLASLALAAGCTAEPAATDQDAPETDECGDIRAPADDGTARDAIVNGTESWDPDVVDLAAGQALAIGAIMVPSHDGAFETLCTGSLVAGDLVVTAAHCLFDRDRRRHRLAAELTFAIGDDVAEPAASFAVLAARAHPSARIAEEDATNDVALLRLDGDAAAAVPELEPLVPGCEDLGAVDLVGQLVQNAGYGATVAVPPVPPNTRRFWTVEEVVELDDASFVVDGRGLSSVCHGDSGGPSLRQDPEAGGGEVRVIGLVSWGDASCVDRDHFTRLDRSCDFIAAAAPGCGEETEAGRCDGDRAIFCEGGERGWVRELDCALAATTCGDAGGGLMRCLDRASTCGAETEVGRCEGNVSIWCEGGELRRESCSARDATCGADGEGRMRCLEPPLCDRVGLEGECDGVELRWCEDGQVHRRDCGACGQRCAWSAAIPGYDCR